MKPETIDRIHYVLIACAASYFIGHLIAWWMRGWAQ